MPAVSDDDKLGLRLAADDMLDDLPDWTLGGVIEIGDEIASGAMGTVYRGRHLRLDRDVAVKMLSAELLDHPDHLARFEREAKTLASLSHPNIVTVHDYLVEDGHPFLIMELVDGRSLDATDATDDVALDDVVTIAIDVCRALEHSHERGVIHRDIKPSNILMTPAGEVKLTDFGVAAMTRETMARETRGGQHGIAGSQRYMAPEVLDRAAPAPGQDIYALGVVVRDLAQRASSPERRETRAALDAIIEQATAFAPERRYSSAEALRQALEGLRGPGTADDQALPADEVTWMRVVAAILTAAAGVVGWMLLVSLTPRWLDPGEAERLTVLRGATLSDGRQASMARLEVPLALLAVGAVAIAGLAYGFLRRHWRREGWEVDRPDEPSSVAGLLWKLGLLSNALYAARLVLEQFGQQWAQQYIPLAGGLLILCAFYVFWMGMLDLARRKRPLARERRLLYATALCSLPVALELAIFSFRFSQLT